MAANPPDDPDDELDRVTVGMLRRAGEMCPRRLHHEFTSGRKLSPLSDAGFEVTNRLVAEATLWHQGAVAGDDPSRIAFPEPSDLDPEQRLFYKAAARGYLALFPSVEATVADLGWSTDVPELHVRLVGQIGIPLELDGRYELRVLRAGRRVVLDRAELAFTVVRAAEWVQELLRVVIFDPLMLETDALTINIADNLDDARRWIAERVEEIRRRADRNRAITGADCRYCACIPGCPKLSQSA